MVTSALSLLAGDTACSYTYKMSSAYLLKNINREASSCNDCNRYTNISKKRHPFFCSDQRNHTAQHGLSGPCTSGNIFAGLLVTKACVGKPDAFCNRS